mmetsp:Transcript_105925/g.337353  ORF Transcript_105925/g.337353 Transcript_105925/m.337353 type:complete len:500 (+) Transcript_105925:121-1620(+)
MASVDYQNSILWRGEDPLKRKFKPAHDRTAKVTRYFPGKAPSWVPNDREDKDKDKEEPRERSKERRFEERSGDARRREKRRKKEAAVILEAPEVERSSRQDAASSRLARLNAVQLTEDSRSERLLRHQSLHQARVLEASVEEREAQAKDEEKEEEEEEVKVEDAGGHGLLPVAELAYDEVIGGDADDNELRALRRERAREVALLRRKEEEEQLKEEEEDAVLEEEDEEESEEESDSDDDPRLAARLKPVFVSKAQRETVREREALQKEEEEAEKRLKEKEKERKVESKALVIDEIKKDDEAEREGFNENDASDIELIDDDDEKNEAEEYELWKIRELKRIKRDKEERLERQHELEWIEKRRAMTEEEREADDRRLDAESNKKEEAKQFNFLQKYYHRGGFFQDKAAAGEEPLYLRDYHEPLEEEKYDKALLPKTMQLRRGQFGKKGQVKHTHLTEVDTTDFQAAWSQHSKQVQKYQEKMAAAKGVNTFDRPSASSSSRT